MRNAFPIRAAVLAVAVLVAAPSALAQEGANSKVCALLPMAELEALFGIKLKKEFGIDNPRTSICEATFSPPRVAVNLITKPPPAEATLDQLVVLLTKDRKEGSYRLLRDAQIACTGDVTPRNEGKRLTSACLQMEGGYLGISVESDLPNPVALEDLKAILAKAAAKRR